MVQLVVGTVAVAGIVAVIELGIVLVSRAPDHVADSYD
jgi:hypothetical protein